MDRRTFGAALITSIGSLALSGCRPDPAAALTGRAMPDLAATLLDGTGTNLARLGKPALIRFWGLWCGPCRTDEPQWEAVLRDLGPKEAARGELALMSVHMGHAPKDGPSLNQWAAARDPATAIPIIDDRTMRLAQAVGVPGTPLTMLIDQHGTIIQHAWAFKNSHGVSRFLAKTRATLASAGRDRRP